MRKYEVTLNRKKYLVSVRSFSAESAVLEINGKNYMIKLDGAVSQMPGPPPPQSPSMTPVTPVAPPQPAQSVSPPVGVTSQPNTASPSGNASSVNAPIPGSVLEILVKIGDTVKTGQLLLKMEAMKMENEINSTLEGTVKAVHVKVGDAVNQGEPLLEIEPS